MRFHINSFWRRPSGASGGDPVDHKVIGRAIELTPVLAGELVSDWAQLRAVDSNPTAHPRVMEKLAFHVMQELRKDPPGTIGSVLHAENDQPAIILSTSPDTNVSTAIQIKLWMKDNKFCARPDDQPNLQILWQGQPLLEMWFDGDERQHRNSATKPAVIKYDDQGNPVLHKFWYKGQHWKTVEIDPSRDSKHTTTHYDRHLAHMILEDNRQPTWVHPLLARKSGRTTSKKALRPLSPRVLLIDSGISGDAKSWASALECPVRLAHSVVGSMKALIGRRPDLIAIYDRIPLDNGSSLTDANSAQTMLRTKLGVVCNFSDQSTWGPDAPPGLALAYHVSQSARLSGVRIMVMSSDPIPITLEVPPPTPGMNIVVGSIASRNRTHVLREVLQSLFPLRYPPGIYDRAR